MIVYVGRADPSLPADHMPPNPPAFPNTGLVFLRSLHRHNERSWFQEHKDEYEELVRRPMADVVAAIVVELRKFAPAYVPEEPPRLSRINRDTRFSKDKSPYRTDISCVFPRRGLERHLAAGFFLRVDGQGAELIAGTFMPGPDQLKLLRAQIARSPDSFRRAIGTKALTDWFGPMKGEQLKRVPKGFDPEHPAKDLLKYQQFYFGRSLDAKTVASPSFVQAVTKSFRAATPFVEMVDEILGNT